MEEMADLLSLSYLCIENTGESDKTSSLIMLTWDLTSDSALIWIHLPTGGELKDHF